MDLRFSYAGDKVWRKYNKMDLKHFYEDVLEVGDLDTLLTKEARESKRPEHGVSSEFSLKSF